MSGLTHRPWRTMSSPVLTTAVMLAWPTTAARPRSIRAAPTPPARAVTRGTSGVTGPFSWRLSTQAVVGARARANVGPARVGFVAVRQDRVVHAPVGAHLRIVPRHPQLVRRVVVAVDHVRDRKIRQGGKAVSYARRYEDAERVVGVDVDRHCGPVRRRALTQVV